jgi:hypothetical protein
MLKHWCCLQQYKFIVDGEWKYAPDQPAMHDERNIINNVVEVQEYVPDHLDSLIGFEPPPSPPERSAPHLPVWPCPYKRLGAFEKSAFSTFRSMCQTT